MLTVRPVPFGHGESWERWFTRRSFLRRTVENAVLSTAFCATAVGGASAFEIVAPTEGAPFPAGATVTIEIGADPGETIAAAAAGTTEGFGVQAYVDSPPLSLQIALPFNVGDTYVNIHAKMADTTVQYRQLRLTLTPVSLPDGRSITELEVIPAIVLLDKPGDSVSLDVTATLDDSSRVMLTSPATGTTYAMLSGGDAVASVSMHGEVEARGAGKDTVVVANGGSTAEVSVIVVTGNTPPQLTATPCSTVLSGMSCEIAISATDQEGQGIRFELDGQPSFARLTDRGDGTGVITIAPPAAEATSSRDFLLTAWDDGDPANESQLGIGIDIEGTLCGFEPRTNCAQAERSQLSIDSSKPARGTRLKWRWQKGSKILSSDVGNPRADTTYALCIYDTTGDGEAAVPGLTISPSATLWKSNSAGALTLKDNAGTMDGVVRMMVSPGEQGRARLRLAGSGANLPLRPRGADGRWFQASTGVTFQLTSSTGGCWESQFSEIAKNDSNYFLAKRK